MLLNELLLKTCAPISNEMKTTLFEKPCQSKKNPFKGFFFAYGAGRRNRTATSSLATRCPATKRYPPSLANANFCRQVRKDHKDTFKNRCRGGELNTRRHALPKSGLYHHPIKRGVRLPSRPRRPVLTRDSLYTFPDMCRGGSGLTRISACSPEFTRFATSITR